MRGNQRSPLWPYLGILTCLFLLSLAAPRTWQPPPLPSRDGIAARESQLSEAPSHRKRAFSQTDAPLPDAADARFVENMVEAGLINKGEAEAAEIVEPLVDTPPGSQTQLPLLSVPHDTFDLPYADLIDESAEWNLDFDHIVFDFSDNGFDFITSSPPADDSETILVEPDLPVLPPPPAVTPLEVSQQLFRLRDAVTGLFGEAQSAARSKVAAVEAAAQRQIQNTAAAAARAYLKHRLAPRIERAKAELASRMTPPQQVTAIPDTNKTPRSEESVLAPQPAREPEPSVRVTHRDDRLAMRPVLPSRKPKLEPPQIAQPSPPLPPAAWPWSTPQALLRQLHVLAGRPEFASWANEAAHQVESLGHTTHVRDNEIAPTLSYLGELAEGAGEMAVSRTADRFAVTRLLRAKYALRRRVDVWQALEPLRHDVHATSVPRRPDVGADLAAIVDDLRELTHGSQRGAQWQRYLQLDQLSAFSADRQDTDRQDTGREERRRLAEQVLARLNANSTTSAQRRFLRSPPLASLGKAMQSWAARPIDLSELSRRLERYEGNRRGSDAQYIAMAIRNLHWSGDDQQIDLSRQLERHYRNANLRVAMHNDLLNRLLPAQSPIDSRVRGRIAGAQVRGRSKTMTDLHVKLINDPTQWRLGIVAEGKVLTNTRSSSWPARFRNRGNLGYVATKELAIGPNGMVVEPTSSKASGRTRLVDVETELDVVPLVGGLARVVARSQHERSRPDALREVRNKLARQSSRRMDKQADPKLAELEERLRRRVLDPLAKLAVVAQPIQMETTDSRLVMRMRLANDGQLAAHTPRPRALSDSLASVQLHDSVLNNSLAGFQLEGRTFTLPELYRHVHEFVGSQNAEVPENIRKSTTVTFSGENAASLKFDEGMMELILAFDSVTHRRRRLKGFKLHAFYRPEVDGLDAKLTRAGTLQFEGAHIRTSTRLALQSVFTSLLAKDRPLPVLPPRYQSDPRFEGLMVTQLVLDDGWMGMGIGPQTPHRVAQHVR